MQILNRYKNIFIRIHSLDQKFSTVSIDYIGKARKTKRNGTKIMVDARNVLNIDIIIGTEELKVGSGCTVKGFTAGGEGNSMDFVRRDCLERIKEHLADLTDLVLTMSGREKLRFNFPWRRERAW